jgi:TolA-binding protein
MGKAAFESGEYSTAERKFDEILANYPDSKLVPEALLMKGRTHIQTKQYTQAIDALTRAAEYDKKELRPGVRYFSGVVQAELGQRDEAIASFTEVLKRHGNSEWFAEAGLRAGAVAEESGDLQAATRFYDALHKAPTWNDRFRGGMRMGRAFLTAGEYGRAKDTFRNLAGNSPNDKDKGTAVQAWGDAHYAEGDVEGARKIWERIMKELPLSESAANAQLAIAKTWDDAGDMERAAQEYDKVREQGTGFVAWQTASKRMAELQSVLDLRLAIEKDDDQDRESKRYRLAEQLLEDVGDVDAALAEYSSLADDAFGTEWGAKALYAEAWVLEHRLEKPDSAAVKYHRLANYYSGTEADRYARKRFGYPVWTVEEIEAPPVQFIRPDDAQTEPEDIVLSRVEPRDVPLPPGVAEVEVWVRVTIGDDGKAEQTKVVKSGGEEFDAAVIEAIGASTFLSPSAGGPRITVAQYTFPPRREEPPARPAEPPAPPAEGAAVPAVIEGSAPGLEASVPDSLVAPESFLGTPIDTMPSPEGVPVEEDSTLVPPPTLRGQDFGSGAPD